jgi:putative membrane protein
MLEVSMSQMAMERSTDANVKKIAQKMIEDHQKVNQEMMKVLQAKNMTPPQQPDAVHTAMLAKLSSETGEDFNECFLSLQVLAHEEALMCFRKEAKMGQDPQLKQFAEKTLPSLREHARMVRKANRHVDDGDTRESMKPGTDHR